MRCPACYHIDTKVVDSRVASDGITIRRRRECLKCSFRFSTREEVEILDLMIVKRDGHKEAYIREKLESGLKRAFEKRSITDDDFKRLINNIERDIQVKAKNEIKSSQIGEIIMKRLKRVDQVAYIRFASVYQSFKDAADFRLELNKLKRKKRRGGKKR
jgi:transcriptional repressor NrdR